MTGEDGGTMGDLTMGRTAFSGNWLADIDEIARQETEYGAGVLRLVLFPLGMKRALDLAAQKGELRQVLDGTYDRPTKYGDVRVEIHVECAPDGFWRVTERFPAARGA